MKTEDLLAMEEEALFDSLTMALPTEKEATATTTAKAISSRRNTLNVHGRDLVDLVLGICEVGQRANKAQAERGPRFSDVQGVSLITPVHY